MITINYAVPSEGEHIISASGHAGYADPGHDIVCAGVSALIYACAAALDRSGSDFDFEDNNSEVTIHVHETRPNDFTDGIFAATVAGLEVIAETYPEYVSF